MPDAAPDTRAAMRVTEIERDGLRRAFAVVIPGASAADCAEVVRHMAGLAVPACLVVPSTLDAPDLAWALQAEQT